MIVVVAFSFALAAADSADGCRELFANHDYDAAIDACSIVGASADASTEDRIDGYRILGTALALKDSIDLAKAAFRAMLALDEHATLGDDAAPKPKAIFNAILAEHASTPSPPLRTPPVSTPTPTPTPATTTTTTTTTTAASTTTNDRGTFGQHTVAVSAGVGAGIWSYAFDGGGNGDSSLSAAPSPTLHLRVEAWPITVAPWVGIDGDVDVAANAFTIQSAQLSIAPSQFTSADANAGVALKGRLMFENGAHLAVRLGGRFSTMAVPTQTAFVGSDAPTVLTVVPGFTATAFSIGAEGAIAVDIAGHRLDLEARGDVLPATSYAEQPDNPGRTVVAFGGAASAAARFYIVGGFCAEVGVNGILWSATYAGNGSRVALVGNTVKRTTGGDVQNIAASAYAGIAYFF